MKGIAYDHVLSHKLPRSLEVGFVNNNSLVLIWDFKKAVVMWGSSLYLGTTGNTIPSMSFYEGYT